MTTTLRTSTALTEADWQKHANNKHGRYVLVVDGQLADEGPFLKLAGEFSSHVATGVSVRLESHTDYVMARTAERARLAEIEKLAGGES